MVVIPVGKAHGICLNTEFAPFPRISNTVFTVEFVDNFECRAAIPDQFDNPDLQNTCLVVPLRWSLGGEALCVVVDPRLWRSSQQSLHIALGNWISSPIEVLKRNRYLMGTTGLLKLGVFGGGVQILGPQSVFGYSGRIHHIKIPLDSEEVATKAARYLAHLARFKQLLDLRETKSSKPRPFFASVEPVTAPPGLRKYSFPKRFELTLANNSEHELHFSIVVLGPEFSIEQLYPASGTAASIPPRSRKVLRFSMELPDCSPDVRSIMEQHDRRNIIRTIVARGNHISWKSVELPRIWDAGQANFNYKPSQESFAELEDASDEWWICDKEIITSPRPDRFLSFYSRAQDGRAEEMRNRPAGVKEKTIRKLETHAGILEAGSVPGYAVVESQTFRDISETLSRHFDDLDSYTRFSAVGWKLPEFINLEESIDLDTYALSFAVRWELPDFIASELDDNWDIGSVLTISGTIDKPYAETCKEYVKLFWPAIEFEAVELMLQGVRNIFQYRQFRFHSLLSIFYF